METPRRAGPCVAALLLALAAACGGSNEGDAGTADAGTDSAVDAAPDAVARPDAAPLVDAEVPWPRDLPPTSELAPLRGRRLARSIVHLHSPLSHDACDGEGWVDGALADEACLANFRGALCSLRIDAAMVTDHAPHLNEVPFADGLWLDSMDEPIAEAGGEPYASRMGCEDAHRVLLTVGSENALMPLGLRRHPGDPSDVDALEALYDRGEVANADAFRAAGGLVWAAHTEGQPMDRLRATDVDGLEIYNLHANVDPSIRSELLGLDDGSYFGELLKFTDARRGLEPDLALLSFLDANRPSLATWDTLLAEGRRPAGSGGCDAHENTFRMPLRDGERADSYRRMMMWITNMLLVDDISPDGIAEALAAGRLYVTHEVLGTPMGFDFVGESGAARFDMGDDAPVGATLRVTRPSLPVGFPADPAPIITVHLLRAETGGAVEVAMSDEDELVYVADEAGAYRVEVRMVPEHARYYLRRSADTLIREQIWVYSNPIFVGMP